MSDPCPRLPRFKNRHQGETCVLVCNGPSLNKMDLEPLKHQTVIGLSKIHLGVEKFGCYPQYLVAVNEKVIGQSTAEIGAMNCVKFISNKGHSIWEQMRCADIINLKAMARPVLRLRQPLVFPVRCRTVAKVLSIGLVVRMCFQCSAGKP